MTRFLRTREYLQALYRRNRVLLCCSITTYVVGAVFAVIVAHVGDPEQIAQLASTSAVEREWNVTTFALLKNNLFGLATLLAGSVTFGASTLVTLMGSGFAHGYTVTVLSLSLPEFGVLFLPHGVFELPGIWLAGAAGLHVPFEFVRYLRGTKAEFLRATDVRDVIVLSSTSLVLISIAAVIEARVTVELARVALAL